jgi:asparagine synthetase B (glutamine-hydrolysing)
LVGGHQAVRLSSDQDYADGLRDCLDRAVRRCCAAHPVGCQLSGGLDSSVAVLAAARSAEGWRCLPSRRCRASTSTGRCRTCYADETPYVRRASGGQHRRRLRHSDACDDFAELERYFLALEAPVRNPTTSLVAGEWHARRAGRPLLGGLYGNSAISWSGWPQVDHCCAGVC